MPSIGNDVWLGANVTLAKGVHVHDGAVVASNSLVTKDVPPYAVVGGNPAVVLKYRYSHDVILRSLSFRWWDYHVKDVVAANSHSLEAVISYLESDGCARYQPKKYVLKTLICYLEVL
ncbi:DapH/DapD/GlmU-related protein [Halomonas meridiana]|uniref:DapH/DapD/GlmU-related protein n=1 Tax=Vreelandella aquamarina TaxID=77097 RepID=UPI00273B2FAF|nr:DapH/DapD/GlmU-related protein [Halomonas meridiana]MDP4556230.1 DapH/DapD/GlmU-related protein [Halomonas meridiana]